MSDPKAPPSVVDPRTVATKLVHHHIGEMEVVAVERTDLDALKEAGAEESNALAWSTLSIGLFVPALAALLVAAATVAFKVTHGSHLADQIHELIEGAVWLSVAIATGLLAVYFFQTWRRKRNAARDRYDRILKKANVRTEHAIATQPTRARN